MNSVRRRAADAAESALPKRLPALDGLRGLAALAVVVHHGFLTVPALAAAYYGAYPKRGPVWLLTYTPVHFLWDGTNAVYLFFMLSGIVLVLPVLRNRAFDWLAYYIRRFIRIYAPVICGLAFAYAVFIAIPRSHAKDLGVWVAGHPNHLTVSGVLHDVTLIQGTSGVLSPLWSLRWEVMFSALLPLFVAFAIIARRRPLVALGAVVAALVVGSTFGAADFFFLSMFAIGTVLTARWDQVQRVATAVGRRNLLWLSVLPLVVGASTFSWWIRNFGVTYGASKPLRWVDVLGVMALLLVVVCWSPAERLFRSRLLQWLGRISFSLYLVHEPILLGSRLLLERTGLPSWVPLLITIAIAPALAHLFARFVEQPLVAVARRAGARFSTPAGAENGHGTIGATGPVTQSRPTVVAPQRELVSVGTGQTTS